MFRRTTPLAKQSAPLLALLLLVALSTTAPAQTKPKRTDIGSEPVRSILWVGTSYFYYNNSMHDHVRNLVRAADPQARPHATSVTISASRLVWHDMESYFRPNAIGSYALGGDNGISPASSGRQYDTVIMIDCSQCPIHSQLRNVFHEYVKKHSDTIRKHGARPVLFMSWAYKDRPQMTAQLAEQYTIAGTNNDALVIPAGLAFAKAIARRPDLEFHQPDKTHPSLLGTYLAANTAYAALYRKSPVGNKYLAGIDPATAQFLQTIAWETTQEYFGGGS